MKAAILYSGGKDSTMATYHAIKNNDTIKYLISIKSKNNESYMFHVPNIHMTKMCSEAMNIPLIEVETEGKKEEELKDLEEILKKLKEEGIEAIYTGAIESTYQRSRIDNICKNLDLKGISPLWHKDPEEYMNELIDNKFKVMIVSTAAMGLDEKWLGKVIEKDSINQLKELNKKYGVHMAFEGGEAETLVLDCPIYKKEIIIDKSEKIVNYDTGIYIIQEAHLKEK
ncbi:MAG: TIGR00289 family protein [Methanobacteriaceae archaeon]|nr:TIGR00289 family protein [Methanobacteriaceae archaeon]